MLVARAYARRDTPIPSEEHALELFKFAHALRETVFTPFWDAIKAAEHGPPADLLSFDATQSLHEDNFAYAVAARGQLRLVLAERGGPGHGVHHGPIPRLHLRCVCGAPFPPWTLVGGVQRTA